MTARIPHQIPCPSPEKEALDRLAAIEGFGGKASLVELLLERGLAEGVPAHVDFPGFPQVKVHLSRDFHHEHSWPKLGWVLTTQLRDLSARYANGHSRRLPLFPSVDDIDLPLPATYLRSTRMRAIGEGRDPEALWLEDVERVLASDEAAREAEGGREAATETVSVGLPPGDWDRYLAFAQRAKRRGENALVVMARRVAEG